MRGRSLGMCAAAAALVLAPPAHAGWGWDATLAERGLDRAVARHRLAPLDAADYRRDLARAVATLPQLSASRASPLAAVMRDVAAQSHDYDAPRALTLFSTLRLNTRQLARGELPRGGTDVRDADGVVYRSFPGRGLRFHALGSFGALNAEAASGSYARTVRLAYALLARARPHGAALVWESFFPWSGGTAPWTSGMTQAVAAQALAQAGFRTEARRAFRAIPAGLLLHAPTGPWIRLYHFDGGAVLNAQLQAAISIREYGRRTGDAQALRLARTLRSSARASLPRFDTGFWSRYALAGHEAPLKYHQYVTSLLWKLAHTTPDPAWRRYATRFRDYWRKPPEIRAIRPIPPLYPHPADGFRDQARISFWLSKPATVVVTVGGESRTYRYQPGRRTVWWSGRMRGPGRYGVRIVAVDRVGNRTDRRLAPIVVRRDREPPTVSARVRLATLHWRASDGATPWLKLRLLLDRGGERRRVELGRVGFRGRLELPLGLGTWRATLVAADSSGNQAIVPLGRVGGLGRLPVDA